MFLCTRFAAIFFQQFRLFGFCRKPLIVDFIRVKEFTFDGVRFRWINYMYRKKMHQKCWRPWHLLIRRKWCLSFWKTWDLPSNELSPLLTCYQVHDLAFSSVVISRPRSRDSSALEFIFQRSRSWSRDQKAKVLVSVSSNFLEGLELGLELLGKSW